MSESVTRSSSIRNRLSVLKSLSLVPEGTMGSESDKKSDCESANVNKWQALIV